MFSRALELERERSRCSAACRPGALWERQHLRSRWVPGLDTMVALRLS